MVPRPELRCPFCNEIVATPRFINQDDLPVNQRMIGDTFAGYTYINHECKIKSVNILQNASVVSGRKVGNTTRQIDMAIQAIFSGQLVKVLDHYENGESTSSNNRLFDLIIRRLEREHGLKNLTKYNKIRIDKLKLEIELI